MLMWRIQESDRRKDEFLAMLAHELRNPLAPISNALETMRRVPERQKEAQETIARQLHHMIHLVNDLMDVSRITQGKIELRKEPVTLQAVIQHALEAAQPLITQRRHQIDLKLPQKDIWLQADMNRLSQIFSNLLNNAAKYTNEGGKIEVSAQMLVDSVRVTVRDDGIGIPRELLSSVFELFAQVDSSLERSQGGLGIGLTLVKNLVELHSGDIIAQSAGLNKGSSFTMTFPVISTPAATLVEHNAAPAVKPHALRILIVDDNIASAQTMGWMMEFEGHDIQLAHEGNEAIALANTYIPDVILLDIGLPGMNGYEICKTLKQAPALQKTMFIAQTGWGQEEHRLRSKEAGFDHHIVKPVNLETLQQLLPSGL
jgi:CheY-like chemotaxis protein/two-component sensor histidine kinase